MGPERERTLKVDTELLNPDWRSVQGMKDSDYKLFGLLIVN